MDDINTFLDDKYSEISKIVSDMMESRDHLILELAEMNKDFKKRIEEMKQQACRAGETHASVYFSDVL